MSNHDDLITINQAAALLPRVRGNKRRYTTVEQWCERAGLIVVYGPKMVHKAEFLSWAKRVGKLPPEPLVFGSATG